MKFKSMFAMLWMSALALVFSGSIFGLGLGQQDNGGIKQDTKDAAHSTADATKKTGRKIKHGTEKAAHATAHGTKKVVHKGAHATSKGASKVEGKTEPTPTPVPPPK